MLFKPTYPQLVTKTDPGFTKTKMTSSNLKGLTLMFLIALFVWSSSFENCSAWESDIPAKRTVAAPQQRRWNYAIFNVLEYGAKGNGYADDTKVML